VGSYSAWKLDVKESGEEEKESDGGRGFQKAAPIYDNF